MISLLFFVVTLDMAGQHDLRFKRITTNSNEDILAVQTFFKDSEGYVWMGSPSFDLVRFDGKNTRKYSYTEIQTTYFKHTHASLIFEDSKKNLWIGTDAGGLMIYNRLMDKFQIANDSATSVKSRLFCQAQDKDGSFWLGTLGSGLLRFDPQTKKFTHYQFDSNNSTTISENYVVGLVFDPTGKLWIATTGGLCSYDPQRNQFIRYSLTNKNPKDAYRYRVIRHMVLSQNKLYLSTYGGLQIFDLKTNQSEHLIHDIKNPASLSHNSLFKMAENPDGSFWIASYGGGLSLYNPVTEKFSNWKKDESNPETISSNNLFSVYLDPDGLLWIGADDNTVCVHDTKAKKFHRVVHRTHKPESIASGWIQSILQENDSVFWLGLNGGGLNRLNLNTQVSKKFINDPLDSRSLGHNGVIAIAKDNQKRIWVGLDGGGLNMMDSETEQFTRYVAGSKNSINNNAVSAMLIDHDNFIWATTFRGGLNIYDITTKKFRNINNDSLQKETGISLSFVKQIFELNGNIWFNTQSQVIVFDKKRNQFVLVSSEGQVSPSTSSLSVEMRPYSETEMLLFTSNEVKTIRYLDPEQIDQKILFKRSAVEEPFKSFIIDSNNLIWYITKEHLVKWNPQSGEKRIYNYTDGISTRDLHALFKDTKGRIFITTLDGLTWFWPHEIRDDTVSRKVVFTDFKLYNHSIRINTPDSTTNYSLPSHISQLRKIALKHSHSFFSIEFAAFEFMAPEKIKYAYKLNGFDREWIQVGNQNFASYTNLDPGEYIFKVKAANPDGFWGTQIASIEIIVTPPYWQTWWFISSSALLLFGLAYSLHRYRLAQTLRVEQLRNKIASDLHDEVGSNLTRISIYSELIQDGANETNLKSYLNRIGSISREVTNTMSDIVWSIDSKSDTYEALFLRMKDFALDILQPKNIELDFSTENIDTDKNISPRIKQNIYLIFKEAITNVVKHAHASTVLVRILNKDKRFVMTISDNGAGIPDETGIHGNGLSNMRRRAHAIHAELTISNSNGTCITLKSAEM
ncbi:MAG: hypothetical protein JNM78_16180 [Cyclobacteriaceae bacterium]|nr:hypothetical protein [Cyclobacteriaceae bacterium]